MVLLHFLRWLKANNSQFQVDLLLLRGGDLEKQYRSVANVYAFPQSELRRMLRRGIEYLKKQREIETKPKPPKLAPFYRKYDAVVGNTVESLEYLKHFKQKGFHTVCWLHELEYVLKFYSELNFVQLSAYVEEFIVVSKAVDRMLRQFGIVTKAHLVYEFAKTDIRVNEDPKTIRSQLGIPPDAFVISGSGTIGWRKGVDLFLQIASQLAFKNPNFYFVWVGGKSPYSDVEYNQTQHDLKQLGLTERVIFTGEQKDPHRAFAATDLFVLTSREDPFPLVCLEAASLGKPVICFEKAGGMPEFVGQDAGAVIPYGDINAFCEKIIYFYDHPKQLEKAGQAARAKLNSDFSLEKSCRAIEKILSEISAGKETAEVCRSSGKATTENSAARAPII